MAIWNRLTSFLAGGALSRAAGDALDPVFETTRQQAWSERAVRVLDPAAAAELTAREVTPEGGPGEGIDNQGVSFRDDAKRHGIGVNRFDLLTELAREEPSEAEWRQLRRRGVITDDQVGVTREEYRDVLRRRGHRFEW